MDPKNVKEGDSVVYVDEHGAPHNAIVNQVWRDIPDYQKTTKVPGLNLVFVNPDESMHDTYGRQIKRETSVVHKTNQPAPGRFWMLPSE